MTHVCHMACTPQTCVCLKQPYAVPGIHYIRPRPFQPSPFMKREPPTVQPRILAWWLEHTYGDAPEAMRAEDV